MSQRHRTSQQLFRLPMFRSFALGVAFVFSLSTLLCTLFFHYQLTETDNSWLPATPVTPTRVLVSAIAVPSHKPGHPDDQDGDLMDEPIPLPDDVLYSNDSNEGGAQAWRAPSESAFRKLRSCLQDRTCTENQQKGEAPSANHHRELTDYFRLVVLVDSMYFRNCLRGDVGGEEIWWVCFSRCHYLACSCVHKGALYGLHPSFPRA